jgi:hypothetical protein
MKLKENEKIKKPRTEKQIAATLKMVETRKQKRIESQSLDAPSKIDLIQSKLDEIRRKKIEHMERISRIWKEEKEKRENNRNITKPLEVGIFERISPIISPKDSPKE